MYGENAGIAQKFSSPRERTTPQNHVNVGLCRLMSCLLALVGILVLVALHVARGIGQVLAAGDTPALARLVEALLVRARVLRRVR